VIEEILGVLIPMCFGIKFLNDYKNLHRIAKLYDSLRGPCVSIIIAFTLRKSLETAYSHADRISSMNDRPRYRTPQTGILFNKVL